MNLPKLIFQSLAPNDFFGLKVFKNAYDTYRSNNFIKNNSLNSLKRTKEMNKAFK
jgi:hypothetical protein